MLSTAPCSFQQRSWHKRKWHISIFKQKPTQISCVKQCKINLKIQNATWRQIQALPAPWFLSTAGKLLRYLRGSFSYFVSPMFSSFYLSIISICRRSADICLCTQIEHSLHSIITRHAPYCWLATSVSFFSKIAYSAIKVNNSNDPAHLNIQYWLILVNLNISIKGK